MMLLLSKVIANSVVFACTPIAVWDGDGPIWCEKGPKIRLHGIAAREVRRVHGDVVDAGCKRGHPCSAVSGVVARDRLVSLLGGPRGTLRTGHVRVWAATMACRSFGSGKGDRTAAACVLPGGGDLSCRLVRYGVVLAWRSYGGDKVCG